ncbi:MULTISPECIES: NAD(P)/FAD-dependent oxidoreductase [Rhizobium]|uniref:FAD/NAD(P)-binding oxidoreductase n=1 Tax=Rhizobium aouanii TaxID=3118145 RepID=A0ABU8CLC6_9HYPH|nr:FAD/NAD(P)-binding oxidoreductase [Rhizobium acaciae]MCW1750206.1 NAD(P)/FAD-dependent oxidoreductase [Rhizobium acaciae]
MRRKLLVVGGSYAACELASYAREKGYGEDIVIVSEETALPYHRPPLSKAYLKDPSEEPMRLRAPNFYATHKIQVELGVKVIGFESERNVALLSNNTRIPFDSLALTVGASPRRLSCLGSDLGNIYYLRSLADARLLSAATADAEHIVIIGAGFIGLEVASVLVQQQKKVTIVETENRVLARAVSPEISRLLASLHVGHGAKLLTSCAVQSLVGEGGVVRKAMLDDGTLIDADIIIAGIGSVPNLALAQLLELRTAQGILVDSKSRTSRTNVFAAGDCAQFWGPFNSTGIRLESVQNATDQSRVAGAVIAGVDSSYDSVPWFWSDQYDVKLQIVGLPYGGTERVVRSSGTSGTSVFHFRNDTCICIESINRPREHVSARRLLALKNITKRLLQDVDFDVSALTKQGAIPAYVEY